MRQWGLRHSNAVGRLEVQTLDYRLLRGTNAICDTDGSCSGCVAERYAYDHLGLGKANIRVR